MNDEERKKHKARVKKYQENREWQSIWFRQDAKRLSGKYISATHYMLAALLPYTEANLKLAFSPSRFFSDLAKLDYIKQKNTYSQSTLRTAYYRAVKRGLIVIEDGMPKLTEKGHKKFNTFQPKLLKGDARLLIAFDIPEGERWKRDKLRAILREFKFIQIQKSVWETKYDCRKYIEMAVEEERLKDHIILYEAARIS